MSASARDGLEILHCCRFCDNCYLDHAEGISVNTSLLKLLWTSGGVSLNGKGTINCNQVLDANRSFCRYGGHLIYLRGKVNKYMSEGPVFNVPQGDKVPFAIANEAE